MEDKDALIKALEDSIEIRNTIIETLRATIREQAETIAIREAENISADQIERWAELPDTRGEL